MANRTGDTMMRTAIAGLALTLAACSNYVTRADFDAAVADLRNTDQMQQQQIDSLAQDLRDVGTRLGSQETQIVAMQGRLRVETTAQFAFDDATVREQDKPLLNEFATVIRDHHPNVLVTVEGFADPAGSATYNKKLGQRRAEAVRDELVRGGLSAEQVRVVSYGEETNRQVRAGAWGPGGEANRRAVLVIDYVDSAQATDAG